MSTGTFLAGIGSFNFFIFNEGELCGRSSLVSTRKSGIKFAALLIARDVWWKNSPVVYILTHVDTVVTYGKFSLNLRFELNY